MDHCRKLDGQTVAQSNTSSHNLMSHSYTGELNKKDDDQYEEESQDSENEMAATASKVEDEDTKKDK
jgi:hypothetical protein